MIIRFTDDRLLPLVHGSALHRCTTLDRDGDQWVLTRRWPSLSTGEQRLWLLLNALSDGYVPTDLDALCSHLDAENELIARRVVANLVGASA